MDRIEFTNIVNHKIATINAAIHSAFVGAAERLSCLAERISAIWSKHKPIVFKTKYPYLAKTEETTGLIAPQIYPSSKVCYVNPHDYLVGKFCKEYLEKLNLCLYISGSDSYYHHLNFNYNNTHDLDLILKNLKRAVREEFGH